VAGTAVPVGARGATPAGPTAARRACRRLSRPAGARPAPVLVLVTFHTHTRTGVCALGDARSCLPRHGVVTHVRSSQGHTVDWGATRELVGSLTRPSSGAPRSSQSTHTRRLEHRIRQIWWYLSRPQRKFQRNIIFDDIYMFRSEDYHHLQMALDKFARDTTTTSSRYPPVRQAVEATHTFTLHRPCPKSQRGPHSLCCHQQLRVEGDTGVPRRDGSGGGTFHQPHHVCAVGDGGSHQVCQDGS